VARVEEASVGAAARVEEASAEVVAGAEADSDRGE